MQNTKASCSELQKRNFVEYDTTAEKLSDVEDESFSQPQTNFETAFINQCNLCDKYLGSKVTLQFHKKNCKGPKIQQNDKNCKENDKKTKELSKSNLNYSNCEYCDKEIVNSCNTAS